MEGYIDIHSHILPQVDDGSIDIEQTINMLNIAYEEGFSSIIVTPHFRENVYDNSVAEIKVIIEQVKEHTKNNLNEIEIFSGREIYYSDDVLALLDKKMLETMAFSNYVLIEFSQGEELLNILNGLQKLLYGGYLPILAHTERYYRLVEDKSIYDHIVQMGAYIQVNAESITGEAEKYYCKTAKALLKNKLIHFVATDAHNDGNKSPKIKKCFKVISKKTSEKYAKDLLINNPQKILKNIII